MYLSLLALGAFAGATYAQAITFSNTTFTAPVTVGSVWSIAYTAGDGSDVAIAFGNSTYAFQVVDGLTTPGMYSWNVAVPVNVVAGVYQLALLQGNDDPVFSPAFSLVMPANDATSTTDASTTSVPFPTTVTATTTTTVTAYYLPAPGTAMPNMTMPQVTYIYYEEECGCHRTSSCDYTAMPTSLKPTTYTYVATECGCTKTVQASCAPTVISAASAPTTPAPATNTPMIPTVAAATTASSPVAAVSTHMPATYTGGAGKFAGSSFGLVALLAAIIA